MIKPLLCLIFLIFIADANADEELMYRPAHHNLQTKNSAALVNLGYDKEKFELAYQAYTYAGKVNDAYALSIAAVRANPDSRLWLTRLAQSASWSNHPNEALNAYYLLIVKDHQTELLDKAITLANSVQRYDMLVSFYEVKRSLLKNDTATLIKLANAYDGLGETKSAINVLNQAYVRTHNPELLYAMTDHYQSIGDMNSLNQTLDLLEHNHGISVRSALMRANSHVNRADFDRAYQALNQIRSSAEASDNAYWEQLANTAWITGHYNTCRFAYQHLWMQNAITEEGLRRLFLLTTSNPHIQLTIARDAWLRYHSRYAFLGIANLSLRTRSIDGLIAMYLKPLPRNVADPLKSTPLYWDTLAKIDTLLNHAAYARSILILKARHLLFADEFNLMYFNFLQFQAGLVSREPAIEALKAALKYYQTLSTSNGDWLNAYGSAYTQLNETKNALWYHSQALNQDPNNLNLMIAKASALAELKYGKSAYLLRSNAWRLIQDYQSNEFMEDNNLLNNYADLGNLVNPCALSLPIYRYLANDQGMTQPLLAYSIDHKNIALADYLYENDIQKPVWASLKLALLHNNKIQQHALVTQSSAVLAPSESTNAAMNTGDIHLAQALAYEHLEKNPSTEAYNDFQTAMIKNANHAEFDTEFEQFGNLQGQRGIVHGDWHESGYTLTPYLSAWYPHSNNSGSLAPRSYNEEIMNLAISRENENMLVKLTVGDHEAFYHSFNARFSLDYKIDYEQNINAIVGYNQRSTLGTFMLIAGSQDEYQLQYGHQWTTRDHFAATAEIDHYQLQDRTQLGGAQILRFEFDHQFYFDYPDLGVSWNTDFDRFQRYHSYLGKRINAIFPNNTTATVSAFIPDNFWQTELSLNIGTSANANYCTAFHPYAVAGILYNQTAGYGTDISLGLNGRLFGRDQLKLYYTRSSVTSGQSQTNFIVGLGYDVFL